MRIIIILRELYGSVSSPLEFELDDGPAIEQLLGAYPQPVCVSELPHSSEELEDKLAVAQALFKEGFLLVADEASRIHHPEYQESAANGPDDDDGEDDDDDNDEDSIF